MRLPNGDKAIVEDVKLYGFLVNPNHPEQPGHAVLFKQLLGIDATNVHLLKSALLDAAAHGDAEPGKPSPFGTKYEIRFMMRCPRGQHRIISVWIINHGTDQPRLVTAFPEKRHHDENS